MANFKVFKNMQNAVSTDVTFLLRRRSIVLFIIWPLTFERAAHHNFMQMAHW